jgi:Predicted redox protein, regulator of disulfide bond formation
MNSNADSNLAPDAELDCVGLFCPMPIAKTKEEIENIEIGQILKVEADDPADKRGYFSLGEACRP